MKRVTEVPKVAPNCRIHTEQTMRYDTTDQLFVCPVKDCEIKARPIAKKSDYAGVVLAGEFELVKTSDDKFYLHIPNTDTMVDINSVVEHTGTGTLHGGAENEWVLMLRFPGIRELDGTMD
jgi:hypothetical protein